QGDGSGNFMPDRPVTRAQMAIIICRILYGNKLNVSQFEGTTQYTDVAATEYYTGYINLATQLGIIGGYGDGRFGPNDTVTTAQAALMLSRALGYFKGNEIAQAQDWALAAVAQATKINMFGELKLATNAELARDNVAEMVFNAISATVPVQYNELLGVYYNENQGIIYALNFNYLETLGYKNFDLVYRDDTQDIYGRPARTWGTGTYNTTTSQGTGGTQANQSLDAQGGLIASRVRMLDKNEIITVALTPDYVYTDKKDQDEVWKDLGRTLCDEKDYVWTVWNNGEQLYSDKKTVSGAYYTYGDVNYVPENDDSRYWPTGKGAKTEIYVDDGDATVTVVEINYYLGEVTRVNDSTVTVKSLSTEPRRLDVRTFTGSGWEVEDLVVFTVDENDDDDFYICEVFEPDVTTGDVKRVDQDDKTGDSYIRFETDGTKYFYSEDGHTVYDLDDVNSKTHPTLDEEYNLYCDPNGYVLAYELAGEDQLNYLYVKDSDEELSDWVAKVIYADATTAKVDIKKDLKNVPAGGTAYDGVTLVGDKVKWIDENYDKTENSNIDFMVWKYTKNSSDAHTLTWANSWYLQDQETFGGTGGEVDIYRDRAYIGTGKGRVIVDQKTVFVDIENEKVYTGYENVPNVYDAKIAYVTDRKGVADVVFIIDGDIYDSGYYFMVSKQDRETFNRSGNEKYWDYEKAFVDGEAQKHFYVEYGAVVGKSSTYILEPGVLYKATRIEEDGGETYITRAEIVALDNLKVESVRKNGFAFSLTSVDGKKELQYTTDKDTKFVLVEYNYKKDGTFDSYTITPGDINDLDVFDKTEEFNTYVTVVESDKSAVQADLVYIIRCHTIQDKHIIEYTDADGSKQTWEVEEGKSFKQTIKAPADSKFTEDSVDNTKLPAGAKVTVAADGSSVTIEFPVDANTDLTVNLNEAVTPVSTVIKSAAVSGVPATLKDGDAAPEVTVKVLGGSGTAVWGGAAYDSTNKKIQAGAALTLTVTVTPDEGYTLAETVTGTTLTVNGKEVTPVWNAAAKTLTYSFGAIEAAPNIGNIAAINLTLKDGDGKTISTDSSLVTEVSFNSNHYITVKVKMPDGYTSSVAPESMSYVVDGLSTAITNNSGTGSTTAGLYSFTNDTNTQALENASGATLNITLVVSRESSSKVDYSGAGVVIDGAAANTSTTLTTDSTAPAALKFKVDASALPSYVGKTKVTYTLTGTSKDGTYTVTTDNAGTVLGSETDGPGAIYATGTKVEVKDVKVEAATVKYAGTSDVTGYTVNGITQTTTKIGEEEDVASGLAFTVEHTSLVAGAEAKFTFVVSGLVGGDVTLTATKAAASDSGVKYSIALADLKVDGAAWGKLTAKGDSAVTITLTSVEVTKAVIKLDQTAITGTGTSTAIASASDGETTVSNTTATAVKLADGKLVLTVTLTDGGDGDAFEAGNYVVLDGGNVVGKTTLTQAGDGKTFTVTIEDANDYTEYEIKIIKS
ncbi:hypothetical protein D1641_17500, partial [Colidextribacter sp. OB.20]|uniref:S-layer homology domain-containing protein n=1 Tax=Colidextribacter sp. OB.20 TaxID=2304568 RepID=UPI00139D7024